MKILSGQYGSGLGTSPLSAQKAKAEGGRQNHRQQNPAPDIAEVNRIADQYHDKDDNRNGADGGPKTWMLRLQQGNGGLRGRAEAGQKQ